MKNIKFQKSRKTFKISGIYHGLFPKNSGNKISGMHLSDQNILSYAQNILVNYFIHPI
jgi:hypothetical protein